MSYRSLARLPSGGCSLYSADDRALIADLIGPAAASQVSHVPMGTDQELALHFALRPADRVEVGILGGDIVVRRAGWLARALHVSCPPWLQAVLLVAERRLLPMALATANYIGGSPDSDDVRAGGDSTYRR